MLEKGLTIALVALLLMACGDDTSAIDASTQDAMETRTPNLDGGAAPTVADATPPADVINDASAARATDADIASVDGSELVIGDADTGANASDDVPPSVDASQDTAAPSEDAGDLEGDAETDSSATDAVASSEDVPVATDGAEAPPWTALPLCSGGVIDAALAPQLPKSAGADAFTPWTGDGWEGITGLITTLQSGDIDAALEALATVAYTACRGDDAEAELLLFTPTESGTGHARAVWRLGAARALVLEAPHPVFDMDTGVEAATLFEATQARGLIVSGTHRCVSDVPSGCDGTTKVCTGSSAPYPLTDMAHVGVSLFQAFHEAFQAGLEDLAISANDWEYLLVSVHGMAGDGISLSNGTSSAGDVDSLPAKLYLALKGALPDAYVTSCNSFEGAVVDKRLCGSTNTQGRHTNGVAETCTTSAVAASGHFAHMEQALEIRQNPEPVAQALMAVFSLSD